MKKWMNTLFFGGCFIVAILLEAYGMIVWKGNLFSVISLGLVVLITGYLFMDSVKSRLMQGSENAKFYMDRVLNEESEKWGERHTEMVNLQKASYTATKKNAVMLVERFNEVLTRLENLEDNNARTLQKIIELQKTSLEGQKNALNLELSYLKDHTKRIIGAMKEESSEDDLKERLTDILTAVEDNNRLLREQMEQGRNTQGQFYNLNDQFNSSMDNLNEYNHQSEIPISQADDTEDFMNSFHITMNSPGDITGTTDEPEVGEELDAAETSLDELDYSEDFYDGLSTTDHIDDELIEEKGELIEENAPDADWPLQDESETEAINPIDVIEEPGKTITPLYDDPNKALTADEIAALFASFGK